MLVEQLVKTNTQGGNYTSLKDFLNQREIIELPFISQSLTCTNEPYKLISNSFITGNIAKEKTSTTVNGGIFATPVSTTLTSNDINSESDLYNNILNLISIKYAGSNDPVLDVNDRTVYGLVQCDPSISDGAAIAASGSENLRILFVVKDSNDDFVVTNITGDIQVHFNALYALRYKPTLFKGNGVAKDIDVLKPPAEFQSLTDVILTGLANNDFFFYDSATQKVKNVDASGSRTKLGLGSSSTLNVPSTGDASTGEVVKGDDSRLSDARTPSAHTIGSHSDYPANGYVTYDDVDPGIILLNRGDGYAIDSGSDDLVFLYDGGTYFNTYFGSRTGKGPNIGVTASQNTAFGTEALTNITTGTDNVALGAFSTQGVVTGSRNIGVGTNSILSSNASDNIAIGYYSGSGLSTGARNIAIGNYTLYANNVSGIVTGTGQVAIGYEALYTANASSSGNTSIGYRSNKNSTSATNNTSLGYEAGLGITTGSNNVAVGHQALYGNGSGVITSSGQVAVGARALGLANASSNGNTSIGYSSCNVLTSGTCNTSVGTTSLYRVSSGTHNIGIGYNAGNGVSTGTYNIAIGVDSLAGNSTGIVSSAGQIAIGRQALYTADASSSGNTVIGYQSGISISSGNSNTIIGHQAGTAITIGTKNILLGANSGLGISTGSENIAIGYRALYGNGSAVIAQAGQIAIGFESLYTVGASASANTSIGYQSSKALTTGTDNTTLGYQSGIAQNTATGNTLVGAVAGNTITSGFYNTFMGNAVGTRTVLGANNTYIGRGANESTSLDVGETTGSVSNSIALGSLAQVDKSNKAQIGATTVVEFQFGSQFKLTTTHILPLQTTETVDLGIDDGVTPKRFNKINLNSVNLVNRTTDASTPTSGVTLYIKNGDLKTIDSSGTIKTYTGV